MQFKFRFLFTSAVGNENNLYNLNSLYKNSRNIYTDVILPSEIAFPLLLRKIDYFVKLYLNNSLLPSPRNTITNIACLQRASPSRRVLLSKNIYGRADFLISSETKDLSPGILATRPFLTRSVSVILAGYSPRLPAFEIGCS